MTAAKQGELFTATPKGKRQPLGISVRLGHHVGLFAGEPGPIIDAVERVAVPWFTAGHRVYGVKIEYAADVLAALEHAGHRVRVTGTVTR